MGWKVKVWNGITDDSFSEDLEQRWCSARGEMDVRRKCSNGRICLTRWCEREGDQ